MNLRQAADNLCNCAIINSISLNCYQESDSNYFDFRYCFPCNKYNLLHLYRKKDTTAFCTSKVTADVQLFCEWTYITLQIFKWERFIGCAYS